MGARHHMWYLAEGSLRCSTQYAVQQLGHGRQLRRNREAASREAAPAEAEEEQEPPSFAEALRALGLQLEVAQGQLEAPAASESAGEQQADPGLAGVAAVMADGTFLGLLCCTQGSDKIYAHPNTLRSRLKICSDLKVQAATSNKLDLSTELMVIQDESLVVGYRGFTLQQLQEGIDLGTDAPWFEDDGKQFGRSEDPSDEDDNEASATVEGCLFVPEFGPKVRTKCGYTNLPYSDKMRDSLGKQFGRHKSGSLIVMPDGAVLRLLEELAVGGQATVHGARRVNAVGDGYATVAVKAPSKEVISSTDPKLKKEWWEYFSTELSHLIQVGSHPHIIKCYGWGMHVDHGLPVLVVELGAWDLHPRSNCELDYPVALQATYQVLSALNHMHIKQVRHGDVKPSNLLQMLPVSPFFHVALCDLGLSVPLPKPGAAPPTMGIGTTSYIPPELQDPALAELAAECWGAADVWSAAIMLLVLLKGGEEVVDCARHNLAWPQQQQQQLQVDPVAGWEPTAQIVADMLKEDLYHLPKEWHPPLQALLEEMLQVDPRLRPTPAQLMQRPIFEDARQQEALHRKRVMMQQ